MYVLNAIFRLDLARLYYSEGLIWFTVIISLFMLFVSIAIVTYILLTDDSDLTKKTIEKRWRLILSMPIVSLGVLMFIFTIFRFSHTWNQNITPMFS